MSTGLQPAVRETKKPCKNRALEVVGIAGFEPAVSRPPDVRFTGLSYIPKRAANLKVYFN